MIHDCETEESLVAAFSVGQTSAGFRLNEETVGASKMEMVVCIHHVRSVAVEGPLITHFLDPFSSWE